MEENLVMYVNVNERKIIKFGNKLKFYEKVNTYIWNNTVGLISL